MASFVREGLTWLVGPELIAPVELPDVSRESWINIDCVDDILRPSPNQRHLYFNESVAELLCPKFLDASRNPIELRARNSWAVYKMNWNGDSYCLTSLAKPSDQSHRIGSAEGVGADVTVQTRPASETNRIGLQISARRSIVISEVVVIER